MKPRTLAVERPRFGGPCGTPRNGERSRLDLAGGHSIGCGFAVDAEVLGTGVGGTEVGGAQIRDQIWRFGGIAMRRVSAPTVMVARRKACVTQDEADHLVLICCQSATLRIRTARGDLEVSAGVPFLWSTRGVSMAEVLEDRPPRVEQVELHIPHRLLRESSPSFDDATESILDTPLGRLLADCTLALERRLPDVSDDELPRLAHAVLGLVGACAGPPAGQVVVARSQIGAGRRERVQQAIRKNLESPALGPKMLCRLVGMSRSNLYRLFEEVGGIARYIHRQRLLDARDRLRDVENRQTVSAIADELCFASASGFSRAFRHEFGCTPTEIRSVAEAALASNSMQRPRPVSGTAHPGTAHLDELPPKF